ncbi:MAG: HEPN domain-containing protein [Armatimonadetes bacterium]|nr:HEPN domain-containing protein [Armatimonadota bacterium]
MTQDERDLLLKAKESISAAKVLLDTGYPDFAASRAYYAMFYVAEAFLATEGLAFSKHAAVISAFGRDFANTERVPRELHAWIIEAQDWRHAADYGPRQYVEPEVAKLQIERAERFLAVGELFIGPLPPEG